MCGKSAYEIQGHVLEERLGYRNEAKERRSRMITSMEIGNASPGPSKKGRTELRAECNEPTNIPQTLLIGKKGKKYVFNIKRFLT